MNASLKNSLLFFIYLIVSLIFLYLQCGLSYFQGGDKLIFGDLTTNIIGFNYLRHAPWTYPFGYIENYMYPMGTYIAFTDSIPLFGLIFKILSPLLPTHFQYIGIWLLSCYIMQLYFGRKILRVIGYDHFFYSGLLSTVFLFTPVLFARLGHAALCAHWLILASIYIYISTENRTPSKNFIYLLSITVISASIHPYLTVMVYILSLSTLLKIYHKSANKYLTIIINTIILCVGIVFTWYSFGYFSVKSDSTIPYGFGAFSANLNTFFNPSIFDGSLFLPSLSLRSTEQNEGFGYLGFGVILLLIYLSIFHRKKIKYTISTHKLKYLFIACIILFLFSLSNKVSIFQYNIMTIELHDSLHSIVSVFRSSGRFLWPLYYFLFFLAFITLFNINKKASLFLFIVLIVQLLDFSGMAKRLAIHYDNQIVENDTINTLVKNANIVYMYPSYELNYLHTGDYASFSYIASIYNTPITTGYIARREETAIKKHKTEIDSIIYNNFLKKDDLIIYPNNNILNLNKEAYMIKELYGYNFAVPSPHFKVLKNTNIRKTESFSQLLERISNCKIMISVADEATAGMNEETKNKFLELGIPIDALEYRGSMVVAIDKGKVVKYQIGKANEQSSMTLTNEDGVIDTIFLSSKGAELGSESRFIISDKEYIYNKRGLNILLLSENNEVLEYINFDTHAFINHREYYSTNCE